jgi:hypothetical protein
MDYGWVDFNSVDTVRYLGESLCQSQVARSYLQDNIIRLNVG